MNKNIIIFSFISILMFSGCFGSFPAVKMSKEKLGSDVVVGERTVRYVGDAIINRYEYTELQGIVLLDNYTQSHFLGTIDIKKGDFLKKYIDKGNAEVYYCGPYYASFGAQGKMSQVCFLDEFDDIENFYTLFSQNHYKYGPFSSTGMISYRKSFTVDRSKPFHKVELIYDGVRGGMLLFTYKEFTDSLTKPAFYSQVRYLKNRSGKPTDISYRSAKIRIYRANNDRIDYKVIAPLRADKEKIENDPNSEYEKFSDHSSYYY